MPEGSEIQIPQNTTFMYALTQEFVPQPRWDLVQFTSLMHKIPTDPPVRESRLGLVERKRTGFPHVS